VPRFSDVPDIDVVLGGAIPFLLARLTSKTEEEITGGLHGIYSDTVSGKHLFVIRPRSA
jgi:hypothetical protein